LPAWSMAIFWDLFFGLPQDWLDVDRVPPKAALAVIQPAQVLTWHPVATLVNNSRNKDPQCNKPITLKYVHLCLAFRFSLWFFFFYKEFMSWGFLHHVVKVFPEGSSCPVALLHSCNGVLETLVVIVVVVFFLLLLLVFAQCTLMTWCGCSFIVEIHVFHICWIVVHVSVGGGWICLCLMEHTVNQMQWSTKWCNKCYRRFSHFIANQSLRLRASFLWSLGWRKELWNVNQTDR